MTSLRWSRTAITLVLCLVALSCGDEGPVTPDAELPTDARGRDSGLPEDGAVGSVAYRVFCEEVARGYVTYLAGCYGTELYDPSDPEEVRRLGGDCNLVAAAVEAGRLAYDGALAARCLAALEGALCYTYLTDIEDCRGVLVGQVPLGDPCYPDLSRFTNLGVQGNSECAAGYCPRGECPSRCTAFVGVGEACVDGPQCSAENFCAQEAGCQPRVAEGQPCTPEVACEQGTGCVGEPATCQTIVATGEPCTLGDSCEGINAGGPRVCVDGTCRAKVAAGERCKNSLNCPDGYFCAGSDPGPGVCTALGADDATCATDDECQPELYCSDLGTCAAYPTDGQPCRAVLGGPQCAANLWCRRATEAAPDGTCQARVAEGGDCTYGDGSLPVASTLRSPCAEGFFCMSDGTCRSPGAAGGACRASSAATCQSPLHCARDTETCVDRAGEGEPCNATFELTCQDELGCICPTDTACPATDARCLVLVEAGGTCTRSDVCVSQACDVDTSTCLPEVMECFGP